MIKFMYDIIPSYDINFKITNEINNEYQHISSYYIIPLYLLMKTIKS